MLSKQKAFVCCQRCSLFYRSHHTISNECTNQYTCYSSLYNNFIALLVFLSSGSALNAFGGPMGRVFVKCCSTLLQEQLSSLTEYIFGKIKEFLVQTLKCKRKPRVTSIVELMSLFSFRLFSVYPILLSYNILLFRKNYHHNTLFVPCFLTALEYPQFLSVPGPFSIVLYELSNKLCSRS